MTDRLEGVIPTLAAIRGTAYEAYVREQIGPSVESLVSELGPALVGYEIMTRGAALVFGCSEGEARDRILNWLEAK